MTLDPLPPHTVYGSYLVFQLFSHKALYEDTSDDVQKSTKYAPRRSWKQIREDRAEKKAKERGTWVEPPPMSVDRNIDVEANSAEAQKEEVPKLSLTMTIGLLVVITVVCNYLHADVDLELMLCSSSLLLPNGLSIRLTVSHKME